MKRTWTIIGVGDVPRSFKWYQALFGQPVTLPAHDYFGQILDSDGTVLLCLHKWGAHEHPFEAPRDVAYPYDGPRALHRSPLRPNSCVVYPRIAVLLCRPGGLSGYRIVGDWEVNFWMVALRASFDE